MTKEQIKQNAEEYAIENDICVCNEEYWSYHDLVQVHIAGAESRQPEIDYLTNLIRDLLVSMSGTCRRDFTDETKELLKEAAHHVDMRIDL